MIKGFVKASKRLPAIGSEVIVKANGSKYVSTVYDEARVDQVPDISFFFNGRHHKGYEHHSIEWLDESIEEQPGEYWKQLAEAAEKVFQCIPDRPENLYHLGFKQAMNNWQKLKNNQS